MILVTGATGQLGRATLEFLLHRVPATELAGLARNPEKAAELAAQGIAIRPGDYEDYTSLVQALRGVDKVLLVSAVAFTDRLAQHTNVINAAKEAGVQHVVYTSLQRKNDTLFAVPGITESDIATEQLLHTSGLTYTIIKNTLWADALPLFVGQHVLETGVVVPVPQGEGRLTYATRRDIAEATARILTEPGHENQEYTLTGTTPTSFADIAGLLSELASKPIVYKQVTPEAYVEQLVGTGLPQPVAEYFAFSWMEAYKRGMFEDTDPTLARLLGRQPTSLKDFLRSVYLPQTIEKESNPIDYPSYIQNIKF
ncbi:SDR family oxidoreductase [Hymenobacter terrenus]|uniref:SDR family oxidoreductase n=1 Tax=Hymenobacter terrenus TaxID=1629124 RepID=UPI000619763A|nr:SDR family oxidoreductase [Hymenobacter terrenus]